MIMPKSNTASKTARLLSLSVILALGVVAASLPGGAHAADLSNNTNVGGVMNGPKPNCSPGLMVGPGFEAHVSELVTYHWNNGRGARPGSLSLRGSNGRIYGPFAATGTSGQNGAQNVNWIANVNLVLPTGMYTMVDSDPATWSQNAQSHNCGFTIIRGSMVATGSSKLLTTPTSLPGPVSSSVPPPGFKPCYVNSGSVAASSPCFGPSNTQITVFLNGNYNIGDLVS